MLYNADLRRKIYMLGGRLAFVCAARLRKKHGRIQCFAYSVDLELRRALNLVFDLGLFWSVKLKELR